MAKYQLEWIRRRTQVMGPMLALIMLFSRNLTLILSTLSIRFIFSRSIAYYYIASVIGLLRIHYFQRLSLLVSYRHPLLPLSHSLSSLSESSVSLRSHSTIVILIFITLAYGSAWVVSQWAAFDSLSSDVFARKQDSASDARSSQCAHTGCFISRVKFYFWDKFFLDSLSYMSREVEPFCTCIFAP